MSIEGQGHFFTIYFPVFYVLCFTRSRYQVSVYRTTGPLFFCLVLSVILGLLAPIIVPTLLYILESFAVADSVSVMREVSPK